MKSAGTALLRRLPSEQYDLPTFLIFTSAPFLLAFPAWLTGMWLGIFWLFHRRTR